MSSVTGISGGGTTGRKVTTPFHIPTPAGTDRRAHRREVVFRDGAVTGPFDGQNRTVRALVVDVSPGGALLECPEATLLAVGDTVMVTDCGVSWPAKVVRVAGARDESRTRELSSLTGRLIAGGGRSRASFGVARLGGDHDVAVANPPVFH